MSAKRALSMPPVGSVLLLLATAAAEKPSADATSYLWMGVGLCIDGSTDYPKYLDARHRWQPSWENCTDHCTAREECLGVAFQQMGPDTGLSAYACLLYFECGNLPPAPPPASDWNNHWDSGDTDCTEITTTGDPYDAYHSGHACYKKVEANGTNRSIGYDIVWDFEDQSMQGFQLVSGNCGVQPVSYLPWPKFGNQETWYHGADWMENGFQGRPGSTEPALAHQAGAEHFRAVAKIAVICNTQTEAQDLATTVSRTPASSLADEVGRQMAADGMTDKVKVQEFAAIPAQFKRLANLSLVVVDPAEATTTTTRSEGTETTPEGNWLNESMPAPAAPDAFTAAPNASSASNVEALTGKAPAPFAFFHCNGFVALSLSIFLYCWASFGDLR